MKVERKKDLRRQIKEKTELLVWKYEGKERMTNNRKCEWIRIRSEYFCQIDRKEVRECYKDVWKKLEDSEQVDKRGMIYCSGEKNLYITSMCS